MSRDVQHFYENSLRKFVCIIIGKDKEEWSS